MVCCQMIYPSCPNTLNTIWRRKECPRFLLVFLSSAQAIGQTIDYIRFTQNNTQSIPDGPSPPENDGTAMHWIMHWIMRWICIPRLILILILLLYLILFQMGIQRGASLPTCNSVSTKSGCA